VNFKGSFFQSGRSLGTLVLVFGIVDLPFFGCCSKFEKLLCFFLVGTLIAVSDVQLFLYPLPYLWLRLDYALSPLAYVTAFVIFRFVVKPRRKNGNVNLDGSMLDKLQNNDNPSGINSRARHQMMTPDNNPRRRGLFKFLAKVGIARTNFKRHSPISPMDLQAGHNSRQSPSQKKLWNNATDIERQFVSLWRAKERHFRSVLGDSLRDYKRFFPIWAECLLNRIRHSAIFAFHWLALRLVSLIGTKSLASK
jgi:hypothetical protein